MNHVCALLLRMVAMAVWDIWVDPRTDQYGYEPLRAFHALNRAADRYEGSR